jgi:hypothetical protein|tara:strand:+ start:1664 stop:2014 length:351 start_codon:yes stop_codon:yes gene_type:complete
MSEKNPVVYVVQENPGKNILKATSFGHIEVLLPANTNIMFSSIPVIRSLKRKLLKFDSELDYLLLIGDPSAIAVCGAIIATKTQKFNVLKWDRETQVYYPVTLDLNAKEDLESGIE